MSVPRLRLSGAEYEAVMLLRNGGKVIQPNGIDAAIAERKSKDVITSLSSNQKEAIEKIQQLENELRICNAIKEYSPEEMRIVAPNNKSKGEATAFVQWSDWHVDEVVDSRTVNGMNAYNPDIVKKRALKLFENTIKLTNTQRHDIGIPYLVLQLGGDFIGGYIHDELQQTNSMSPLDGIFFSSDLIASGISYILNHGKFKGIRVICNVGNHGRLTKKMQYANGYSMNLETYLYRSLAHKFSSDKEVQFIVPESEIAHIEVYNKTMRFFHGHQVKFKGGIGGISVPLYKAIHRWNANNHAFYNFMCDKHTYSNPTPDCQLNGSLKGFDAYAMGNGFSYQEPLQSFSLLDSKRGVTIKSKIFCE